MDRQNKARNKFGLQSSIMQFVQPNPTILRLFTSCPCTKPSAPTTSTIILQQTPRSLIASISQFKVFCEFGFIAAVPFDRFIQKYFHDKNLSLFLFHYQQVWYSASNIEKFADKNFLIVRDQIRLNNRPFATMGHVIQSPLK